MGTYRAEPSTVAAERAKLRSARSEALDIVLAWLVWLPQATDVAAAATAEIARIDRAGKSTATLDELRGLLEVLARSGRLH